jgi:tRNA-splicing ligase RtcB
MPIGGVIACKDVIIPNAVGVDIGCGMCAVKTTYKASDIDESMIKQIIGKLRNKIPTGFEHHKREQNWQGFNDAPDIPIIRQELKSARKQLGTLGGGNHFIEIQSGNDGYVWLMVHSGSRNFGYKIAREYNAVAQKECEKFKSIKIPLKGENGLAFLPLKTKAAKEYIHAMNFALLFARENRKRMMSHLRNASSEILGCSFDNEINIHHNFAVEETHFRNKVWVHRKGATQAKYNQMGIIPGSMGTASYITKGLGNPESYSSCSHGAGRIISRSQFNKTYTVEECDKAMEGIVFGRWNRDRKGRIDISEAPQAYKNIDTVMESQRDLVAVVVKLRPLGVMKG